MRKQQFIISIMAEDRVGIVADVTDVIRHLDGNLADLSQTVLRGYFTMIVIATFPAGMTRDKVRQKLLDLCPDNPLEIGIKTTTAQLLPEPDAYTGERYVLTAVGPDKIGLVAAVAHYLQKQQINIVDLTTRLVESMYTMILMLDLPPETDIPALKTNMTQSLTAVGIHIEIQHYNIFRATNEV